MSRALSVIPFALLRNRRNNKVLHERNLTDVARTRKMRLMCITFAGCGLSPTFWRVVVATAGAKRQTVERGVPPLRSETLIGPMETSFFYMLSVIVGDAGWYVCVAKAVFVAATATPLRAPDQFESANRVIELLRRSRFNSHQHTGAAVNTGTANQPNSTR